jgi:hypothetical protein
MQKHSKQKKKHGTTQTALKNLDETKQTKL